MPLLSDARERLARLHDLKGIFHTAKHARQITLHSGSRGPVLDFSDESGPVLFAICQPYVRGLHGRPTRKAQPDLGMDHSWPEGHC